MSLVGHWKQEGSFEKMEELLDAVGKCLLQWQIEDFFYNGVCNSNLSGAFTLKV